MGEGRGGCCMFRGFWRLGGGKGLRIWCVQVRGPRLFWEMEMCQIAQVRRYMPSLFSRVKMLREPGIWIDAGVLCTVEKDRFVREIAIRLN